MTDQQSNGSGPAVLDPEESWHLPAQVFVPARPGPILDVRELDDGRPALPVYSSIERLVTCCGHGQPWMLVSAAVLPELQRSGAFEVVVLDAPVPRDLRDVDPGWDDPGSAAWDLVYVPSRRFHPGDEQARLELQPMPGGRLALMAYSSEESLAHGCGPGQPWVSVPSGLLDEARRLAGAGTIVLDTPLPVSLRHEGGHGGR